MSIDDSGETTSDDETNSDDDLDSGDPTTSDANEDEVRSNLSRGCTIGGAPGAPSSALWMGFMALMGFVVRRRHDGSRRLR